MEVRRWKFDVRCSLPDERARGGELELAADGGVGGVGVGPFGVGGELEPHAAGGGLLDEGVAVEAGAGGLADGAGLAGLGGLVGLEGLFEFGAFGLGDLGEFVGGGLVVDRLGPAFEQGATVVDLVADAVGGEEVGVFEEVFLAGAGLEEADDGDQGLLGVVFLLGGLDLAAGGDDGFRALAAGLFAEGEHGVDAGLGDIVLAGLLALVEGDERDEVFGLEGGAADFLGLGERGELGGVQRQGAGSGLGGLLRIGGWDGGFRHGGRLMIDDCGFRMGRRPESVK